MDIIKIINESFSMSDLAVKLYGYSNGVTNKKAIEVLENNGFGKYFFVGKNKNRKHQKIKIICPICLIEFETTLNGKKTCSLSCSNSYFQHGRNNPNFDEGKYEERYKKVSNTLKYNIPWNKKYNEEDYIKECPNCKNKYIGKKISQKYCSKKCQYSSEEYRNKLKDSAKERVKNGTHKGWQTRNIESYPEKFFKQVLNNNNIDFIHNKVISKRKYNIIGNGNYFLDFYLPETNIDLEIDGKQHNFRVEEDEYRDLNLSKIFDVYRIKWLSINSESGKEYMKNEIEKFINYYNMKLKQIQKNI